MRHDVTKEIKELANLTGKTIEQLVKKYELYVGESTYEVWNRRDESSVKVALNRAKEEIEKEKIAKERMSGYRWVKEISGWAVAGDFTSLEVGDEIVVTKASGDRQTKKIAGFTSLGNAKVI